MRGGEVPVTLSGVFLVCSFFSGSPAFEDKQIKFVCFRGFSRSPLLPAESSAAPGAMLFTALVSVTLAVANGDPSCSATAPSPIQSRTGTVPTDAVAQPSVPVPAAYAGEPWYKRAKDWVASASRADKEALVNGPPTSWNNESLANPSTSYVGNIWGVPGLPPLALQDNGNGFRPMTQTIRETVMSWPGAGAVASTWDADLGETLGAALAEGHKMKGANVILGPGLNLWLFPQGGRNGEYLTGESPMLGHKLGGAYVRGVQGPPTRPTGVMATAKHLVAYNMETDRLTVDATVDDATLEKVFFPPFLGAIESGVGAIMCSYNFVNSVPACANAALQQIKSVSPPDGAPAWPGFLMSDWWAIYGKDYSTTNLDMAMPGNSLPSEVNAFIGAGGLSNTPDARLDDMAMRIAGTIFRNEANSYCTPAVKPDPATSCCERLTNSSIATSSSKALARKIASEGIVLLRNEKPSSCRASGGMVEGRDCKPVLPLRGGMHVVVVGSACDPPPYTQEDANNFHCTVAPWNTSQSHARASPKTDLCALFVIGCRW